MMENEMELQEEQAAEKRKKEKKGMPVLLQLVLLVVLALLLRNVMGTVLVKGSSMEPNFYHGDFVFINKLSTAFGSLQKGDVVKFTETKITDPVIFKIGTMKKFLCCPGISGSRMAVQLTGVMDGETDITEDDLLKEED